MEQSINITIFRQRRLVNEDARELELCHHRITSEELNSSILDHLEGVISVFFVT